VRLDFVCGDEVYGACTELREYCEDHGQAYVLRVPSSFRLILAGGVTLTCKQAAARLGSRRGWEVRSAGTGSKGDRWYAWAWLATASRRHYLLIRRHLTTGELAFQYCYLPEGQPASPSRPVCAAGLRWPCEEDFEFGKDCFGLDQSQVRRYHAIARHTVLVMAALAICAVTAACCAAAPAPRHPPRYSPTSCRPPTPGRSRSPSQKPGAYSVTRPRPAVPGTGWTGGAATKPGHTGTTSEHGWPAASRSPWSGNKWLGVGRMDPRGR